MRTSLTVVVFLLFLTPAAAGTRDEFVPGEILVMFRKNTPRVSERRIIERLGGTRVESFENLRLCRLRLKGSERIDDAVVRYASHPEVEFAQPNYYYRLAATPNDPDLGLLYGLSKISAHLAWDTTTGNSNVVVAVIDTGIRYTHQDLAANMWTNAGEVAANGIDDDANGFIDDVHGWDFRFNDNDPIDENGHGTHVAGTIGAVGNNGIGVVGVNWNVHLMAIKIYNSLGNDTTSAMLIAAYEYVRMMKTRGVNIRVTNNSYGGCQEACGSDKATKAAIDALGDADILNVFAAGNSGTDNDVSPFFPASYDSPSILAVGASDPDEERHYNYGKTSVDLAAPGITIRSTVHDTDASYGNKSGTSMATPHVAGAAALLAAQNPSLSAISLKATLINTVDHFPQWEGFVRSGGRLNIAHALQSPTVCSFVLSNQTVKVGTKGGYFSINVTAPPNCDYAVKTDTFWIYPSSTALTGSSAPSFRVRFNRSISREGSVLVASQNIQVNQSRP